MLIVVLSLFLRVSGKIYSHEGTKTKGEIFFFHRAFHYHGEIRRLIFLRVLVANKKPLSHKEKSTGN